jgi:hypothetical protein
LSYRLQRAPQVCHRYAWHGFLQVSQHLGQSFSTVEQSEQLILDRQQTVERELPWVMGLLGACACLRGLTFAPHDFAQRRFGLMQL